MFFRLSRARDEEKILSLLEDSVFFFCPTLVTARKNIFLYFFTKLKTYHLSYSDIKEGFNFDLTTGIPFPPFKS